MTDYGKILCYNNEGISVYNSKGEIEWNAALNMTNPKITTNNGCAVVADIGGRSRNRKRDPSLISVRYPVCLDIRWKSAMGPVSGLSSG